MCFTCILTLSLIMVELSHTGFMFFIVRSSAGYSSGPAGISSGFCPLSGEIGPPCPLCIRWACSPPCGPPCCIVLLLLCLGFSSGFSSISSTVGCIALKRKSETVRCLISNSTGEPFFFLGRYLPINFSYFFSMPFFVVEYSTRQVRSDCPIEAK